MGIPNTIHPHRLDLLLGFPILLCSMLLLIAVVWGEEVRSWAIDAVKSE